MIFVIPFLVLVGIATGPLGAKVSSIQLRRCLGWLVVIVLSSSAHLALLHDHAFLRMVGICCVLLAAMKGLVYAEWAGKEKLSLPRYFIFSFLWFGMDPGTFRATRRNLTWRGDVIRGALLLLLGIVTAWFVWFMGWRHILVMFVPLSWAFHFGILRMLKGVLRWAGFPVRTLFPNLLEAKGIADFWSMRWNVGYSQMMQRLVGRPIETLLGKNSGMMAVFLVSGLLHELAIALPVQSGYGLPTLFFTLHGFLTVLEGKIQRPIGKIPALLAVAAPLPWLFPPVFQKEVISVCIDAFGKL